MSMARILYAAIAVRPFIPLISDAIALSVADKWPAAFLCLGDTEPDMKQAVDLGLDNFRLSLETGDCLGKRAFCFLLIFMLVFIKD
jgi:hypothetical protein